MGSSMFKNVTEDLDREVTTHILSFIDDLKSLLSASLINRYWNELVSNESLWRRMCAIHDFAFDADYEEFNTSDEVSPEVSPVLSGQSSQTVTAQLPSPKFSYRGYFKQSYTILNKWRHGGTLLRRNPLIPPGVVTSIALDSDWVVIGLDLDIHIFSARTGVSFRSLIGHTAGLWVVALVKAGGERIDPSGELTADMKYLDLAPAPANQDSIPPAMRIALGLEPPPGGPHRATRKPGCKGKSVPPPPYGLPSNPCGASEGWGQPNSLVVSAGCDKELRVWDIESGSCIYTLNGHTSTIRCLKVLHSRPIAVTGSRDHTLRVWDIQHGRCLRVLQGHEDTVRTIEVCGNRVASGSYDFSCRLWDVDTGQCIHVFRGHTHQIYTIAFDGIRVVSGGGDTIVRVWDVETGVCSAVLEEHTSHITQLQLSPHMLVTAGSDGNVIVFSMPFPAASPNSHKPLPAAPKPSTVMQCLYAHYSAVTCLQFDSRFLVTGGDGRLRLFEFHKDPALDGSAGFGGKFEYVREMCDLCVGVWQMAYTDRRVAVVYNRVDGTHVDIWSYDSPTDLVGGAHSGEGSGGASGCDG